MAPTRRIGLDGSVTRDDPGGSPPTVVAHRAGNDVETASQVRADWMVELDVHVLDGRVELRHAKVLRPTRRLWDKWYLLPRGSRGVAIEDVLDAVPAETPLLIDSKVMSRRGARAVVAALPLERDLIVSSRTWWTLPVYRAAGLRVLHSCGDRFQVWLIERLGVLDGHRGACLHERFLDAARIARLRQRSDLVFSWGATTRERCDELTGAGVTGLILDQPVLADPR